MDIHSHRKDEHLFIAQKLYQKESSNGLQNVRLIPNNLPELSLTQIDLSSHLVGKDIAVPFFINAMTGGSPQTKKINERLAKIAQKTNLAMAVGSQSVALKNPAVADGFSVVRQNAKQNLIIGNLGASHSLKNAKKAIRMLDADALELHLNVGQELVMPEGDLEFFWKDNIKQIVANLSVPVLVKEVGMGISPLILQELKSLGVKYVDLSGKGGTNFIAIENQRRTLKDFAYLEDFGLTTAEVLIGAQAFKNDFSLTASGGIKTALDIAKCIALGADNVGISNLFLHTLVRFGDEALISLIEQLKEHLRKIMLLVGCKNIVELQQAPYILTADLLAYQKQCQTLLKQKRQ
ncbi:type 2 isopentenyl-diphosphate Delta-isomerase [Ligilactobacillus sp. Marseille-Q7487]|uniref:type 2 isopentenyl-diphosphate Delta-isomerase n=1 Tax=Ligilactobacillus sp. Marseille-Q7487 TaxID=3022128 RepID=UPI0024A82B70|nr:type 2 isopentenyl-diphosphate Delta-isomerase [Ligilactobacillus sp. Marseille-Q7487]